MDTKAINYRYRNIARFVIEALSPLAVSSGEKNVLTDSAVAIDVNGLPYIPGTTLAGLFRHAVDSHRTDCDSWGRTFAQRTFGYQETSYQRAERKKQEGGFRSSGNASLGSSLIFTEAKLVGKDGNPVDGLRPNLVGAFYNKFKNLPIRQHAKISERGSVVNHGKFDEQVVFQGSRFCFEVEMQSPDDLSRDFLEIINQIGLEEFRIGGGSRSGFGKIKIVSCVVKKLDLMRDTDLEFYLNKSANLACQWEGDTYIASSEISTSWSKYVLELHPDNFFIFGSGIGDADADITQVREDSIEWTDGIPSFSMRKSLPVLIPATSIKGALSHRIAYHYNRLKGEFADKGEKIQNLVGEKNKAVKALFGNISDDDDSHRGNVLFSDIIIQDDFQSKVIPHVAIDRFTGAIKEGALFQEKPLYGKGKTFSTEICVNTLSYVDDNDIKVAFEDALKDICRGLLPLGGGASRGNGTFSGKVKRDGEIIYGNE